MFKKTQLLAAVAILALSAGAARANPPVQTDGNASASASAVNAPTNVNAPTTIVDPKITVSPDVDTHVTNTNVNAPTFAPHVTVSPDVDVSNKVSNDVDQHQLQGQNQGQDQSLTDRSVHTATSGSTSGASAGATSLANDSSSHVASANDSSTHSASSSSGGNALTVNEQAQARNPVSTAFAVGTSGVGNGLCRFGPGIGYQAIGGGASLSLGVFKDKDCKVLAYAEMLLRLGQGEAAVQYLSAQVAEVSKAVTQARTVK